MVMSNKLCRSRLVYVIDAFFNSGRPAVITQTKFKILLIIMCHAIRWVLLTVQPFQSFLAPDGKQWFGQNVSHLLEALASRSRSHATYKHHQDLLYPRSLAEIHLEYWL